uniref:Uncharacterized protein n=1 Tax=Rhizophora mucronata TaxID=61149 RepID=A0A2P2NHJ0_RHIMU
MCIAVYVENQCLALIAGACYHKRLEILSFIMCASLPEYQLII